MTEPILDYDTRFDPGRFKVFTEARLKRRHAIGKIACAVRPHEWMFFFDLVNGTSGQVCKRCGKKMEAPE